MKALTLKPPWAFCITHLGKRIENRTWKPPQSLIGQRFAIHGGKPPTSNAAIGRLIDLVDEIEASTETHNNFFRDILPFSGIVATAVLEGWTSHIVDPWFDGSGYGWILKDVIVLPEPIPCKGALGLWNVPEEIAERLTPPHNLPLAPHTC